ARCHHNARLRQRGGSPARGRTGAATARNSRSRRARAATRARGSASWVSRSVHLEEEVSRLPQGIPECERDEILRDPRKYGLHEEPVLRVPPRSLPTGGTVAFRRFSCGELHAQCYTSGQAPPVALEGAGHFVGLHRGDAKQGGHDPRSLRYGSSSVAVP